MPVLIFALYRVIIRAYILVPVLYINEKYFNTLYIIFFLHFLIIAFLFQVSHFLYPICTDLYPVIGKVYSNVLNRDRCGAFSTKDSKFISQNLCVSHIFIV